MKDMRGLGLGADMCREEDVAGANRNLLLFFLLVPSAESLLPPKQIPPPLNNAGVTAANVE
jgi:hypothetical protein